MKGRRVIIGKYRFYFHNMILRRYFVLKVSLTFVRIVHIPGQYFEEKHSSNVKETIWKELVSLKAIYQPMSSHPGWYSKEPMRIANYKNKLIIHLSNF